MTRNYLNNAELLECIVDHRRRSEEAGETLPMPDYAGKCIMLICQRMGSRHNFRGYSWVQEMVSDAILDCTNAFDLFDHTRFDNPFGYLSMIAWRAMVRRIFSEKRETYLKHKSLQMATMVGGNYDAPDEYTDPRAARRGTSEQRNGMSSSHLSANGTISDGVVNEFEALLERRRRGGKRVKRETSDG